MKLFKSAVYQIKNISLFHSYIILAFRISFFSNLAASKTNPGHTCSSLKILPGSQTDNVYAVIDIETTGGQYNKEGITHRWLDRKSTRLNSSHVRISYAVFCLKKKRQKKTQRRK